MLVIETTSCFSSQGSCSAESCKSRLHARHALSCAVAQGQGDGFPVPVNRHQAVEDMNTASSYIHQTGQSGALMECVSLSLSLSLSVFQRQCCSGELESWSCESRHEQYHEAHLEPQCTAWVMFAEAKSATMSTKVESPPNLRECPMETVWQQLAHGASETSMWVGLSSG